MRGELRRRSLSIALEIPIRDASAALDGDSPSLGEVEDSVLAVLGDAVEELRASEDRHGIADAGSPAWSPIVSVVSESLHV